MLITLPELEALLPSASQWFAHMEADALQRGEPLNLQELGFTKTIGIKLPEKIRLLKVDAIPHPADSALAYAAEQIGLSGVNTVGRTFRYGIYVRSDRWRDIEIVAHELAHTHQYERLGGILPFLRQYVSECRAFGYSNSPLELEAKAIEKRLTGRNL